MTSIRYRLARLRLRPAILATNTDSSASMRSDTPESRLPLFHSHPIEVKWYRVLRYRKGFGLLDSVRYGFWVAHS